MKCKIAIPLFFIICFFKANGQTNLVPNNSFENFSQCPVMAMELDKAIPWFQPNKAFGSVFIGSTDYFNSCSVVVGVPSNSFGYQYASTGFAYAGFGAYIAITNWDQREYLETKLYDSLIQGKQYEVSFNLSLAEISDFAISTIGVYLSDDTLLYSDLNQFNIPVTPQIESDSTIMLADTIDWMQVKKTYTAQGGERFITIGNFRNNANTPYVQIKDTTTLGAYYYIDDISVICLDCIEQPIATTSLFIPNAFSPNGDGANDRLRVLGNANKIEFKVFDRWGEMVYSYTGGEMPLGTGWDGTYKGKALDNAVFVYFANVVLPDGKEVQLKGNVSLIR